MIKKLLPSKIQQIVVVGRVSDGGMDAVLVVQGVTKAKDEGGIIQF